MTLYRLPKYQEAGSLAFGSINTILELVISEELIKCYQLISQNVIANDSKELITVELNQLRTIYLEIIQYLSIIIVI